MPEDDDRPLEDALYGAAAGDFSAYDPQEVAPTPDGAGEEQEADRPAEPLPAFDPRHSQEFEGLLYLGALSKTFRWLGHRFAIRTLRTDELINVALVVKDYIGSDGYDKAYQSATTGACLMSVDGKPIPVVPISDADPLAILHERTEWVMRHYFPPVLDRIYDEYIRLELVVRAVLEDMGKASG
jgi:hypothetical protein